MKEDHWISVRFYRTGCEATGRLIRRKPIRSYEFGSIGKVLPLKGQSA